ncbi:MAG: hypothetical protein DHS20C19_01580 [Acidimicrobiales bacterium]|nr:MAG: hypothetical protein DHS20C19_01580 [Acidimicrobiales bacterium]
MGEILRYRCEACGFESEPVMVGRGFSGVQHAPIGCDSCRAVWSVPVATWRDEEIGVAPPVDAWTNGDRCPQGHRGAYVLESTEGVSEHRCAACAAREMHVDFVGLWD